MRWTILGHSRPEGVTKSTLKYLVPYHTSETKPWKPLKLLPPIVWMVREQNESNILHAANPQASKSQLSFFQNCSTVILVAMVGFCGEMFLSEYRNQSRSNNWVDMPTLPFIADSKSSSGPSPLQIEPALSLSNQHLITCVSSAKATSRKRGGQRNPAIIKQIHRSRTNEIFTWPPRWLPHARQTETTN